MAISTHHLAEFLYGIPPLTDSGRAALAFVAIKATESLKDTNQQSVIVVGAQVSLKFTDANKGILVIAPQGSYFMSPNFFFGQQSFNLNAGGQSQLNHEFGVEFVIIAPQGTYKVTDSGTITLLISPRGTYNMAENGSQSIVMFTQGSQRGPMVFNVFQDNDQNVQIT